MFGVANPSAFIRYLPVKTAEKEGIGTKVITVLTVTGILSDNYYNSTGTKVLR